MRVIALSCPEFAKAAGKAAGVPPLLPPLPFRLPPCDFLYIDMPGAHGHTRWYCERGPAISALQVADWDLAGTVVFAANCYLADEGSPMLDALLEAGARYVIAGEGVNYGGRKELIGSGLLARYLRKLMALGVEPMMALAVGKHRMSFSPLVWRVLGRKGAEKAARDTLRFKAFYRAKTNDPNGIDRGE